MYCWGDEMGDWARPGAYKFDDARKEARKAYAARMAERGGRSYQKKSGPNEALTTPKKSIRSESATPLVVAIDVTGSMSTWPRELFDRLPLLYQTLSQYHPELEISFAAIGDARCDRWPLQITEFSKGFDLEDKVQALYGEGGGGDAPESYQLFAYYMNERVEVPNAKEKPFLLVFGDARFHDKLLPGEAKSAIGADLDHPRDGVAEWQRLAERWNVFFLRRPAGASRTDGVHAQWSKAIGDQRIVYIDDELRGMDYAMGIVARSWGRFEDFAQNMRARQDDDKVDALQNSVLALTKPTTKRRAKKAKKRRGRLVPTTRKSSG